MGTFNVGSREQLKFNVTAFETCFVWFACEVFLIHCKLQLFYDFVIHFGVMECYIDLISICSVIFI